MHTREQAVASAWTSMCKSGGSYCRQPKGWTWNSGEAKAGCITVALHYVIIPHAVIDEHRKPLVQSHSSPLSHLASSKPDFLIFSPRWKRPHCNNYASIPTSAPRRPASSEGPRVGDVTHCLRTPSPSLHSGNAQHPPQPWQTTLAAQSPPRGAVSPSRSVATRRRSCKIATATPSAPVF